MKDNTLYVDQILDSIRKIESYVHGFDKEKFLADEKTQSATLLQLTLIGEVSKKISAETKAKIDLPWKEISGFRDRAVHNYFDIDLNIVWATVTDDIPVVKEHLGKYNIRPKGLNVLH